MSRQQHQGLLSNFYAIKASQTGRHICQSERHNRAIIAHGNANGIDIDHDNVAANAFFCVSGVTARLALKWKSFSPCALTGEQNTARAGGDMALSTGCGSHVGTPVGLAHNEGTQPTQLQERTRSVNFSPINQVTDIFREETFENEGLRDLIKKARAPFKHEAFSYEVAQKIKGEICSSRSCPLSRGRRGISPSEYGQGPRDGERVRNGDS